ncbi:MAG: PD-(D/E)XK nuclease family protein [Candidatus Eisenbacteria bacterium]|nr:PD-(D/E)XK nuclease family protein [Candidatus Eisenbacteria bacterium]
MTERRENPYVWVTWISKLLAGEAHCEWAAWFKAHHAQFEKRPPTFDFAKWNAEHGRMVRERARALAKEGYNVGLEEQNKFNLKGASGATLGGKPDLVAVREAEVLVVDCKTGQTRGADYFQVLVYMLALPLCRPQYKNLSLSGRVEYQDHAIQIPPEELTQEAADRVWELMERVVSDDESARVPSAGECAFCDITRRDCPDRIDEAPDSLKGEELAPF